MLLYAKITSLTSFSLKSSDIGKISNLLAIDLGAIEQRFMNVSIAVCFPFVLVGITSIMILRVGWIGIAGIMTVILLTFLSFLFSRKCTNIVDKINIFKDLRLDYTAEIIEGAKNIKIYGL